MTPRIACSLIARRAAKVATITALALGVVASTMAPLTAAAAPLDAPAGPDLTVGDLYFNDIKPGESARIPILVKNQGTRTAHGPQVLVYVGGFTKADVSGSGWSCKFDNGRSDFVGTAFLCTAWELGPGESKPLVASVKKGNGDAFLVVEADPDGKIQETNGTNNRSESWYR